MKVRGLIGEPPDTSNWPHPAAPDANPFPRSTASAQEKQIRDEIVRLGKALFWDEQVSVDNTVACGTCHQMTAGGTDNRIGAIASNGNFGTFGVIPQAPNPDSGCVEFGSRTSTSAGFDRAVTGVHSPTMIGAYVFERQFWDLRAGPHFLDLTGEPIPGFRDWASLEDQAVGPPISPIEMGHEGIAWEDGSIQAKLDNAYPLALVDPTTIPPDILPLVQEGLTYRQAFDRAFESYAFQGDPVGVTRERFGMAIAHYTRTLIPDQAPIDLGTMTPEEVAGFELVKRSGCFECHSASGNPTLTEPGGRLADPFDNPLSSGFRFNNIFGAVKTPTLRNLGLRARFFHTGRGNDGVNTLDALIQFYDDRLGDFGLNGSGPEGQLTDQEFMEVRAFFENALTDPRVRHETFPFDRPQLASERPDFDPFGGNEYGIGTAGPSGLVPEIIANGVPFVGTPPLSSPNKKTFKIGVGNSPAYSSALLMVSTHPAAGPIQWVGPNLQILPPIRTGPHGIGTIHIPLPWASAFVGVDLYCQWMVFEGKGVGFSNAATFTPFLF